mmetsp:Transcript_46181/g.106624  ORF Transcript_46181/g.106624 Transcript_46181/m.106624 type:complete len:244 (+) Transcript_46181:630-1361(+)
MRRSRDERNILRSQVPASTQPPRHHIDGIEFRHGASVGVARDHDFVRLKVGVATQMLKGALELVSHGSVSRHQTLGNLQLLVLGRIREGRVLQHEVRLPIARAPCRLPRDHADLSWWAILVDLVVSTLEDRNLGVIILAHDDALLLLLVALDRRCTNLYQQLFVPTQDGVHVREVADHFDGLPLVTAGRRLQSVFWVREVLRGRDGKGPHESQLGQAFGLLGGLANAATRNADLVQGPRCQAT